MIVDTQENVTGLNNGAKGDFDALFSFWSGRVDPDGNIGHYTLCDGSANSSKYCDPEMDKLLIQARQKVDPAERKVFYDQIGRKFIKDKPIISLWYRQLFIAHTTKVQGFVAYPDGLVRLVGVKM